MCKAWKNSMAQAKATGKAEGRAEGRAEGLNEGILSLIASFKELSIGQPQAVEQLIYSSLPIILLTPKSSFHNPLKDVA